MARRVALPEAIDRGTTPYVLGPPGWWLVLSDIHLPFHDRVVLETAVAMARRRKVVGVLLNGDTLDSHELSRFDRTPDEPRYAEEIAVGRQFLEWLRSRFRNAEIVYKEGNHDERIYTFLCRRAPELFGLLSLPELLHFEDFGIDHVGEKRVLHAGKLNIIHGHEYPGGGSGVNPARGLFLKAKGNVLAGHFHQVSEHHEPDINGKPQGAWSVGCACGLTPRWLPLNKWCAGFAFVHFDASGTFSVENKRIIAGKVV
jgi:predicted phosphodiesterase